MDILDELDDRCERCGVLIWDPRCRNCGHTRITRTAAQPHHDDDLPSIYG